MDIIRDEFLDAQQAIERRISEIFAAFKSADFERLVSYHLNSPKFTAFKETEPIGRLGVDENNRVEQEEREAVDSFVSAIHELKIDVFESVAVTTSILEYTVEVDGRTEGDRIRMTLVFVDDGGDWKIAHEHLSTFPSSG